MAIANLDLSQLQQLRSELRAQRNMMLKAERGNPADDALQVRIESVEGRLSTLHGVLADGIEAKTGPD